MYVVMLAFLFVAGLVVIAFVIVQAFNSGAFNTIGRNEELILLMRRNKINKIEITVHDITVYFGDEDALPSNQKPFPLTSLHGQIKLDLLRHFYG